MLTNHHRNYKKRLVSLILTNGVLLVVNLLFLIYPVWYFVDFISSKITISHSILSHGQKIRDLEYKPPTPLPSKLGPYIKIPDPYRNHFQNVNVTLPCESSMILLSFSANASIDVLVFRHVEMFEAYMNLSSPSHLHYLNETTLSLLREYPLDRSTIMISDNSFASRFFSTKIYDSNTSVVDSHELCKNGTFEIYLVFRKLITQQEYISIDFWYWLEYQDNRGFFKFNVAILFVLFMMLFNTIYLLNAKSLLRLLPALSGGDAHSTFSERLKNFLSLDTCLCYDWCLPSRPRNRGRIHALASGGRFMSEEDTLNEHLSPPRAESISFHELAFTSFTGKEILHPISGEIAAGRLTAIVGKSGSSKSTFINTLCRRASHGLQSGKVFVSDKEITRETCQMIGFVPQDDIIASDITVREALEFSLRYRKRRQFSSQHIIDTLGKLGLLHVQHSLVSEISGGERRRTSIGIEIVNDTPILILDEPTSGLDSETALSLALTLRSLAEDNHLTIICVIHQPSAEVFQQFHNMLLFSEGQLLLHASVNDVIETLKEKIPVNEIRLNPADEILRTLIDPINGTPILRAIQKKQEEEKSTTSVELVGSSNNSSESSQDCTSNYISGDFSTAPFWAHFVACMDRSLRQFFRNWRLLIVDILICVGIGALIGSIFNKLEFKGSVSEEVFKQCPLILRPFSMLPMSDKIAAFVTFVELALAMIAIMRALRVFGHDMENFKRESFSGLNSWMFFASKDLISLIPIVLISLSFTAGLFISHPQASFGIYYLISILTILASFPIGYMISFFFSPHTAQLAATMVVLLLYSISGNQPTLPEVEQLPFPFSYFHIFTYLRFVKGLLYMVEIETRSQTERIDSALFINGYEIESVGYYWYAMIFWCVLFRVFAVFLMWQLQPHSLLNRSIMLFKAVGGKMVQKVKSATAEMRDDIMSSSTASDRRV
ncbi:hypothetical protein C9374_009915 [Naegleria lovaniensis]|uniref:ABC transporter domain-containing protein n=1 Tax=Naegleria lovaniensis TaxID=51637 RepID=A0AA88KJW0_NAELO|nr:uncharacterized protein C9374_009915 [Naegleria lovaniensis]KAG2375292.1 hypothetical protein C9374_009915 [Naegleria lovaniensis]